MKKFSVVAIAVLILTIVCGILISNKARMAERARSFKLAAYPVLVITVNREDVGFSLEQMGVVSAYNDVIVVAETQGRVIGTRVEVGSYVAAGTPLVQVDNELSQFRYSTARTNYEKAKKDLERYEALYEQGVISTSQVESSRLALQAAETDLVAARKQYEDTYITAPISGTVAERMVDRGAMVNPGTKIANIVDISRLKVKLSLAEADAFRIRVGDPVEISTAVYPGIKFAGRVNNISAKGDEAHTYPVEIVLSNPKANPLKAGMFGKVRFASREKRSMVVIPREALVGSIKAPSVYIVDHGVAQLQKVVLESKDDHSLMVLKGLKGGERLVVGGQENLTDQSPVTIVE
jgi:RND family efflux transporter MFP subunit